MGLAKPDVLTNVAVISSTNAYLEECKEFIIKQGYNFKNHLVYLIREGNVYWLKVGYQSLGYIREDETTEPECRFVKLINFVRTYEGNFDCLIFPCYLDEWEFAGECIVINQLKDGVLDCNYVIGAKTEFGVALNMSCVEEVPGYVNAFVKIHANKPSFQCTDIQLQELVLDLNECSYLYGTWSVYKKNKNSFELLNTSYCDAKSIIVVKNKSRTGCSLKGVKRWE